MMVPLIRNLTSRTRRIRGWGQLPALAIRRVVVNLLTLFAISVVMFGLLNFKSPRDIARSVLGREVSEQQLHEFIVIHDLDRPLILRYASWAANFMKGDLGTSAVTDQPVAPQVISRLARSALLAFMGSIIGVMGGIGLGVSLAKRIGSHGDLLVTIALLVLASLPEFLIGIALYLVLVVWTGLFPTQSGFAFAFGSVEGRALAFVLPSLTIALLLIPQIARITRVTMAEAMLLPCVTAARLRGLTERLVTWDHSFRIAAVPLVSVVGLNVVYAFAGVVVVEYVFGFPGVGTLLVQSIGSGDLFTTQAVLMIFAAAIILINICVDLAILMLNPRMRVGVQ